MSLGQIVDLLAKVPTPVWSLVSDTLSSILRGDTKSAALHSQAAAARMAAHLALHAKDPRP